MKNTKLYPFERNRYYTGKMLTSADFQAEQTYFNNKRRLMNRLMYGSGIVCGCDVFKLDELSLLVESGVAIDKQGREIVVESSVVKKLSAIEGFEDITGREASLCLRYQEEPVHTVYTLNQGAGEEGREYEYNRISEGYQLFLKNPEEDRTEEKGSEFLSVHTMMDSEDFSVTLFLPSLASRGRAVKLVIEIEKKTEADKRLTLHGKLRMTAFLTDAQKSEIVIDFEDVAMKAGECVQKEYWLLVSETAMEDAEVLWKEEEAKAYINMAAVDAVKSCSAQVLLTDQKPREMIQHALGRRSLERKQETSEQDDIVLADLKLIKLENAYMLEEVAAKGYKKYIPAPAEELLRSEYMEYFVKENELVLEEPEQEQEIVIEEKEILPAENKMPESRMPEIATGVVEIPLGEAAKKGDIRYSGEIMHGLGNGNVYVNIGYEYIAEDMALQESTKNTIYGNPGLFKKEKADKTVVKAETAVKVMNDKGSFVVAVRLLENVEYLMLTYRWVAMKFPAENVLERKMDSDSGSIVLDNPTVVLGTGDHHYFHVRFQNMSPTELAYELTEAGSGEIRTDGVYTAPAKEGVYEIKIYCAKQPMICTYAYAIVKKKAMDELDIFLE